MATFYHEDPALPFSSHALHQNMRSLWEFAQLDPRAPIPNQAPSMQGLQCLVHVALSFSTACTSLFFGFIRGRARHPPVQESLGLRWLFEGVGAELGSGAGLHPCV